MSDTWTKTDFRFVEAIAEGGMGRVEMVVRRSEHFQRVYAMKRLKPGARDDPSHRAMFLDEARLCGLLRHPNVVSVLDVGEDDDGPYMVMEFISGVTAAKLLRRYSKDDELPSVQLCVRIALDVARGLAAAHGLRGRNGQLLEVVHRDLSPQNVLIGFDGRARLSDFGVARAKGRETKTETGVLKGKLAYMAPEQIRFEPATRQSDLFALGVVIYELLSARRLYRGSHAEIAKEILSGPPPDIADIRPDVHPSLVALLFQLLAKEAGDRPETADAVVELLQAILDEEVAAEGSMTIAESLATRFSEDQEFQETTIARALSLEPEDPPKAGFGRGKKVGAALAFAAAVGLGLFAWNGDGPEPTEPVAAEPLVQPQIAAPRPPESAPEDEESPLGGAEPAATDTEATEVSAAERARRRRNRRRRRDMRGMSVAMTMASPMGGTMGGTMGTAENLRDFGSAL